MDGFRRYRHALALLAFSCVSVQAQPVLEEVLVTAQKRDESQQDVPISISVTSGEQLQAQNLVELESLAAQLPNVHIGESAIGDKLFIRGIGSGINAGFEQAVGTFVDGVYHGRSLQSRSQFLDIERVEVLRGPQSTYFGSNAIAGALNIVTRQPSAGFGGHVSTFREFAHDERYLEAAIGGGITDTLSVRMAGLSSSLGGWVGNVGTGQREGSENNHALRLGLLWTPAPGIDAALKLEQGDVAVDGRNLEVIACPPATGAAGTCLLATTPQQADSGGVQTAALFTGFDDRFDARTQYNGPVPAAWSTAVNTTGAAEAGRPIPAPQAGMAARDRGRLANGSATLTLNLALPGDHLLTAITAHSEYDFAARQNSDFMPLPLAAMDQLESFSQQSQELRLMSPGGATLDWLAGLYWQQSKLSVQETLDLYLPPPYFQPAASYFADDCRVRLPASGTVCRLPATIADTHSNHVQDEESGAVFAALTWNLGAAVSATLGGRYMRVDKSLQRHQQMADRAPGVTVSCPPALAAAAGCLPGLPLLLTGGSPPRGAAFGWRSGTLQLARSDRSFMPSLILQWSPREALQLYASISDGFKAGGYDQRNLALDARSGQFGPERVVARELGFKSQLRDGMLHLNLALFRSDYDDLQVSTFDGVVNFLVNNAASARTQGIEADLRWLASDNVSISAAVALLDARWRRFPNAQCTALALATAPGAQCREDAATGLLVQDLGGETLPMSPAYSGNVAIEHGLPLSGGLDLQTQLLVYFEGDKYLAADNDPATLQPRFAKANLRMAVASDRGWELAVVVRNLTDVLTSAHSEDLPLGSVNSFFRLTDRTRSWALQGSYRF